MAEVILNCPQCQRQLRVTEDLLGRPVRCPACGLTFTVPSDSGQAQPMVPPPMAPEVQRPRPRPPDDEYEPEEEYYDEPRPRRRRPQPWDYEDQDRDRTGHLIMLPAIFLLVANAIGLLANCFRIVGALVMRHEPPPPDAPEWLKKLMEMSTPEMEISIAAVFAVISLLAMLGAIQMLRRRTYGLAMAGSILSMVNLGCGCCILGLPFGIWALVILLKPEVKAAFH